MNEAAPDSSREAPARRQRLIMPLLLTELLTVLRRTFLMLFMTRCMEEGIRPRSRGSASCRGRIRAAFTRSKPE